MFVACSRQELGAFSILKSAALRPPALSRVSSRTGLQLVPTGSAMARRRFIRKPRAGGQGRMGLTPEPRAGYQFRRPAGCGAAGGPPAGAASLRSWECFQNASTGILCCVRLRLLAMAARCIYSMPMHLL